MESAPAVFAGTVFTLFGVALMLWTTVRSARREPVVEHAGLPAAVMTALFGVAFLTAGSWCLLNL